MNSIEKLIIHPTVRPQQKRTFDIIQSKWTKYNSFFCALPTGSGKTDLAASIIADYIMDFPDATVNILVPFKMHQDFWLKTLSYYGKKHKFSVASLKGRSAYYCSKSPNKRANLAPCAFNPQEKCNIRCELKKARAKIKKTQVRVLNWWVYRFMDFTGETSDINVFDEAHNLLNLENLLRLEISRNFLLRLKDSGDLLKVFDGWIKEELGRKKYVRLGLEKVNAFFNQLLERIYETEVSLSSQINRDPRSVNEMVLKDLKKISETHQSLKELISSQSYNDLTVFLFGGSSYSSIPKLVIQPFEISYIFQNLFHANKNIFLSATIGDGDYLAKLIGLKENEYLVIREKSAFPKENHPFIILEEAEKLSTSKSNKAHTFKILQNQLSSFLSLQRSLELRGIVLTASFELSNLVEKEAKRIGLTIISHHAGGSEKAVKDFISNHQGDLLITPVAWEGISLDDDLARICLIPKLPFPYLGDPLVKKKVDKYPNYLKNEVLISIQQAHGRIQRNKDDWGITVCFDGNFRWIRRYNKSIEQWFAERIKELPIADTLQLIKTFSDKKSPLREEKSKRKKDFERMQQKDRDWLKRSGLADLL